MKHIEKEIQKIEKLGYKIYAGMYSTQIYDKTGCMIIDSDFNDDYYQNLAGAINAFWNES